MEANIPDEMVKAVFPRLTAVARDNDKSLDETFYKELINYGRRLEISRLEEKQLEAVIEHFGRKAIIEADDETLGAIHITQAILKECEHVFKDCSAAGLRYLTEKKLLKQDEAEALTRDAHVMIDENVQ